MRTAILTLACLSLCSCGVVNSATKTVGNILGVEEPERANTLADPVIRNEYHAACEKRKQDAILEIMNSGGGQ